MTKVIGVRFKKAGKIYYFDPGDKELNINDNVIVETTRGMEFGKVVIGAKEVSEEEIVAPLKQVIRKATESDTAKEDENRAKEKEAFNICLEKIKKHDMQMKLVDVEYTFDNNKIIFYFTADSRVDFRELVKDLAAVFRTRIELRQIGVRDESKFIGGLGPCCRVACCNNHLGDFQPVSIKMAKEQGLSLSPNKISGLCGRLMCCLNYEQSQYEEARKKMPKVGSEVKTPEGQGTVIEINVLLETAKVKLTQKDGTITAKNFKVNDLGVTEVAADEPDTINIEDEEIKYLIED
ncbi:MAG: stage 0 sporulation family protein [Eubacteriales bacterium]